MKSLIRHVVFQNQKGNHPDKEEYYEMFLKNTFKCKYEICNKKYKTLSGAANHVSFTHNVSVKNYYDRYIKTENEEICNLSGCNNVTNFCGINRGYQDYCCQEHYWSCEEYKNKMSDITKNVWENNEVFNSPEYRNKLSASMIRRWNNPNSWLNSIERSILVSNYMKQLWKDPKGPFRLMKRQDLSFYVKTEYTELFYDKNYREKILLQQNYIDPISGEILFLYACLHHIDYNKQNDSRNNLIFLSPSTHGKTGGGFKNRKHWEIILFNINKQIINKTFDFEYI